MSQGRTRPVYMVGDSATSPPRRSSGASDWSPATSCRDRQSSGADTTIVVHPFESARLDSYATLIDLGGVKRSVMALYHGHSRNRRSWTRSRDPRTGRQRCRSWQRGRAVAWRRCTIVGRSTTLRDPRGAEQASVTAFILAALAPANSGDPGPRCLMRPLSGGRAMKKAAAATFKADPIEQHQSASSAELE